ncbi:Synembryn-like protein [Neolecta irregularis DAH-3]|uniref:Synembryn-like protein n=1 Tax=Neolecta irregularis (strain DAH-3) TaxID=1198029 RepID=A0A1U7LVJ2_NEOID|nr:Synembryn-like protein [Neolecta irregularis DAH-3]|eukprot:OLL26696.1 Synembryn-like protein [Neolecta irregularis DAH-3]
MSAQDTDKSNSTQAQSLVDRLSTYPENPTEIQSLLLSLKEIGRIKENASPIYSEQGISMLIYFAFENKYEDVQVARECQLEALRCLANALLLEPLTRTTFGSKSGYEYTLKLYNEQDFSLEFLLSRMCFLGTVEKGCLSIYEWSGDIVTMTFHKLLERHVLSETDDLDRLKALAETLKFMFNVTLYLPDVKKYEGMIPLLLKLLERLPKTLTLPTTQIVNALLNLSITPAYFPSATPRVHVATLVSILDDVFEKASRADQFEDQIVQVGDELASLFGVLRQIFQACPEDVLKYGKEKLLPTLADRKHPLGKGHSLADHLLRTSTCVHENVREHSASLLFELSDSNASKFVQNIGFGYASGFLVTHNIPIPQLDSGSGEYNHVTGQDLAEEDKMNMEMKAKFIEMTDEEKEQEAERLFVLFERMNKTGVVDVKNPVQVAREEGRFEELP